MPGQRAEHHQTPGESTKPIRIPQLKYRSRGLTPGIVQQEPSMINALSPALQHLFHSRENKPVNIGAAQDYIINRPFQFTHVSKRRNLEDCQLYVVLAAKERAAIQGSPTHHRSRNTSNDSTSVTAEDGSSYSFQMKQYQEELLASTPEDPALNSQKDKEVYSTEHPLAKPISQYSKQIDSRSQESGKHSQQSKSSPNSPPYSYHPHKIRRKPIPQRFATPMLGNSWFNEMHHSQAGALGVVDESDPFTSIKDSREKSVINKADAKSNARVKGTLPKFGLQQIPDESTSPSDVPLRLRSCQTSTSPVALDSHLRPRQLYNSIPVITDPQPRSHVITQSNLRSPHKFQSLATTDSQLQTGQISTSQITAASRLQSPISQGDTESNLQSHTFQHTTGSNLRSLQVSTSPVTTESRLQAPSAQDSTESNLRSSQVSTSPATIKSRLQSPANSTPPTATNSRFKSPSLTISPTAANSQYRSPKVSLSPTASPYFRESPFTDNQRSGIFQKTSTDLFTGQSPININKKKRDPESRVHFQEVTTDLPDKPLKTSPTKRGLLGAIKAPFETTRVSVTPSELTPLTPMTPPTPATQYFEEFPL